MKNCLMMNQKTILNKNRFNTINRLPSWWYIVLTQLANQKIFSLRLFFSFYELVEVWIDWFDELQNEDK